MRVPYSWLREYCDPGIGVGEIAERLAMTGTEVERIEHHGVGELENFVVGKVVEAVQHPDADRLRVCSSSVVICSPSRARRTVSRAPATRSRSNAWIGLPASSIT